MSGSARERRTAATGRLAYVAILVGALALAGVTHRPMPPQPVERTGLVFPSFASLGADVDILMITAPQASYHIVRDPDGWVIPEAQRYPVSARALEALGGALATMEYAGARTRDPEKHARLSLLSPGRGGPNGEGEGVLVEALSVHGDTIATLIVGAPTPDGDGFYARFPREDATFAVTGALPDLARPSAMMALSLSPASRETVASVIVTPADGTAYTLARGAQGFDLVAPEGFALIGARAGDATALATADLRFAGAIRRTGEDVAVARHSVGMADGTQVAYAMFERDGVTYAVVDVSHPTGSVSDTAQPLADIGADWAFALPALAAERMTRPLADVAAPVPDADPDEG